MEAVIYLSRDIIIPNELKKILSIPIRAKELVKGMKAFLARIFLLGLFYVLAVVAGFILKQKQSMVKKQIANVNKLTFNKDNYLNLRKAYDELAKDKMLIKSFLRITELDNRKNYFLGLLVNYVKTVDLLIDTMETKLASLDSSKSEGKFFSLVKESELWNNRVKSYSYLI